MRKDLLSALCLVMALPGVAHAALTGAGTADSPYLIKSAADMKEFATSVTGGNTFEGQYVRLDADLSYGPTDEFTQVGKFASIRDYAAFGGTFDGNGHTISGVTLSGGYGTGMFAYITDKATLKNLTVSNSYVTSTDSYGSILVAQSYGTIDNCHVVGCTLSSSNGGYKGMIAGHGNCSTISNCSSSGILSVNGSAGGVVGQLGDKDKEFSILNCTSSVSITDSNAAQGTGNTAHVGGIAGSIPFAGIISGCSYTGSVSGGFNGRVGGIAASTYNVDIADCWVAGYLAGANSASATGGIVANLRGGSLSNCLFAGTIYNTASASVGGLIGEISVDKDKTQKIENCLVYGVVYASSTLKSDLSELIGKGQDFENVSITNCYYDKQMSGLGSETRSLSTTQLVSSTPLDGFSTDKWVFSSSLYPRLASAKDNEIATLFAVPVYIADGERASEITSDFTLGAYAGVEWELTENEYATLTGNTVKVTTPPAKTDIILNAYLGNAERSLQLAIYPKIFDTGNGTEASPFEIASLADWKKLIDACNNQDMTFEGQYFAITADIDLAGEDVDPVGKTAFSGIIDGRGHAFKNMQFPSTPGKLMNNALFGIVGPAGVVKNIVIDASANLKLSRNFAPLVYTLNGKVENCVNYASMTSTNGYVAGLVYSVETNGIVVNCANYGNITITDESTFGNCGGIAQTNKGKIDNCLNAGNISGTAAKITSMGGIVAANNSTGVISNVVNLGSITGAEKIGGIAGTNSGGTINDALSVGVVTSTTTYASVGAISGTNTATSHVTNAVFDNQIVIYNSIVPDAIGMSTAALTAAASNPFAGNDLWTVADGAYPMLKSFADNALVRFFAIPVVMPEGETRMMLTKGFALPDAASVAWSLADNGGAFTIADGAVKLSSPKNPETNTLIGTSGTYTRRIPIATVGNPFEGDGTEASPYLISTSEQMNTLADLIRIAKSGMCGKYFRMTADLDFTGVEYKIVSSVADEQFEGIFDGNGKKITNLTISTPDATNAALFGVIGANGEVKNLTIESSSVSGKGTVGAFAGTLRGKLTDCVNRATVTGSDAYVGGLVGKAETDNAQITGCVNYGTVTGAKNYVAGIAAAFQGAAAASEIKMTNCANHGAVNGASYVAGVVANAKGAVISGCHNTGNITATKNVAGILAYSANNIELLDCYNSGTITGSDDVAGVLDYGNTKVNLTRCYNTGSVSAAGAYVAGLVGRSNTAAIVQCFNTGDVSTTASAISSSAAGAAGLVAYGCPAMTDCYNSGNVTSADKAAGIISYRSSSTGACTVKNVYNTGVITVTGADKSKSGSIAGEMSSKTTYVNVSYDSSLSELGAVCNDSKDGVAALSSAGLVAAQMGESWTSMANHYPVLTYAKDVPAALVASAAIIFGSTDQNIDNVTGPFTVGCAGGVQWDGGDAFSIAADGTVTLKNTVIGTVYPLTVSLGDCSRTYNLTVNATSGISSVEADGAGVSVADGRIVIAASAYTVYSISGSVVATGSGEAELDLMPGVYVVVADGSAVKVCVR